RFAVRISALANMVLVSPYGPSTNRGARIAAPSEAAVFNPTDFRACTQLVSVFVGRCVFHPEAPRCSPLEKRRHFIGSDFADRSANEIGRIEDQIEPILSLAFRIVNARGEQSIEPFFVNPLRDPLRGSVGVFGDPRANQ